VLVLAIIVSESWKRLKKAACFLEIPITLVTLLLSFPSHVTFSSMSLSFSLLSLTDFSQNSVFSMISQSLVCACAPCSHIGRLCVLVMAQSRYAPTNPISI
jgi:hypothetical protein